MAFMNNLNFDKCFIHPTSEMFPDSNGFAFICQLGVPTNDGDIKVVGNVKFVSTDLSSLTETFQLRERLLPRKTIDMILKLSKDVETRISNTDLNYMCCIEV